MIQISGGKSALWWEQKRQMSGGKCDKLGGGKSDKGKWTTANNFKGEKQESIQAKIYPNLRHFYPWKNFLCQFYGSSSFALVTFAPT